MKLYNIEEPSSKNKSSQPNTENNMIFGIDLGTTNSLIAFSSNLKAQIINIDGNPKVPSVVGIKAEKFIVGNAAIALEEERNLPTIHSVKRAIASHVNTICIGEKECSPIEVTTNILKYLKEQAEARLQQEISEIVVTVPAYFDEASRSATKEAAKLASLKVRRMLNEPTAAAIAYNLDRGVKGHVLVFDMGGGTLDISILKMHMGVFQVIATGGDNCLGGDDYDQVIAQLLTAKPGANSKRPTPSYLRSIKEDLCNSSIQVAEISMEEFENSSSTLTKRAIGITKKVVRDSDLKIEDIKHIILVGGATRLPFVKNSVVSLFAESEIHCSINPDLAVVMGAAYQAEYLSGKLALPSGEGTAAEVSNMQLLIDVIPLSLGIELADGNVEKIIFRNTPLPIEFKKMFTTAKDGQSGIKIHIVQGEAEKVEKCRSIAKFELNNIPKMAAGEARLEVAFNVDVDGLLSVTATELVSQIQQKVEVKPSYGLTTEEAIKLVRVAKG